MDEVYKYYVYIFIYENILKDKIEVLHKKEYLLF